MRIKVFLIYNKTRIVAIQIQYNRVGGKPLVFSPTFCFYNYCFFLMAIPQQNTMSLVAGFTRIRQYESSNYSL
jgi:hypothetical protein